MRILIGVDRIGGAPQLVEQHWGKRVKQSGGF
jgi:hypothetical protein